MNWTNHVRHKFMSERSVGVERFVVGPLTHPGLNSGQSRADAWEGCSREGFDCFPLRLSAFPASATTCRRRVVRRKVNLSPLGSLTTSRVQRDQ
jgi:hypothetical protein